MELVLAISLLVLIRAIQQRYGLAVRVCFVFLSWTQFHYNFYASRFIPNTYAAILVNLVLAAWMVRHLCDYSLIWCLLIIRCSITWFHIFTKNIDSSESFKNWNSSKLTVTSDNTCDWLRVLGPTSLARGWEALFQCSAKQIARLGRWTLLLVYLQLYSSDDSGCYASNVATKLPACTLYHVRCFSFCTLYCHTKS